MRIRGVTELPIFQHVNTYLFAEEYVISLTYKRYIVARQNGTVYTPICNSYRITISLYTTSHPIFTRPRYFDDMQGIFGGVRPEISVPIGNQNAEMCYGGRPLFRRQPVHQVQDRHLEEQAWDTDDHGKGSTSYKRWIKET